MASPPPRSDRPDLHGGSYHNVVARWNRPSTHLSAAAEARSLNRYPLRAMVAQSGSSDTNQQAQPNLSRPTWDGSPNSLPAFMEAIIKYLPRKNPNYRNLVEQGCCTEGRKTIFYSVNHVNRYANNEIRNRAGEKGTFRAPVVIDPNQLIVLREPNPIVYAPNPTDTQLKLSDSPFDVNPLSRSPFAIAAIAGCLRCSAWRQNSSMGLRRRLSSRSIGGGRGRLLPRSSWGTVMC